VSNKKQSIRQHLDAMFAGDSLVYLEKGNKILIAPATTLQKNKPRQTVSGQILDKDTKTPLVGVTVILGSEGPPLGAITDEQGRYRFEKVPVGRHGIRCTYVGYQPSEIPLLMVGSGKESIVNMEMEEAAYELSEVRVVSRQDLLKPINRLSVVSSLSFSAYEVENFPGSISDISRAAVSFPGVFSPNDGQNHIVIRGNSPKGLQWRMEGIEIPNLNHFSDIGASGGGVNVISNNMLGGSDFLTSAFPAEYGNALSGVFDLRLRTGNNEQHEQTLQVSFIGTEAMVEGPLNKTSGTTYIAQYRYSTLKIMESLGLDLESVPDFQDLSFKVYHPTKKAGVFSLFGIGGLSHETGIDYEMDSDMFTTGISHNYTLNPRTFMRSVAALSGRSYDWESETNIGTVETPVDRAWNTNILDYTLKGSTVLNRKLGRKHRLKTGIIYEMAWNESRMGWSSDSLAQVESFVDSAFRAGTLQAFGHWNWQVGRNLVLNTGVHFIQFYLNGNYSLEPRLGMQWAPSHRHILSAGFGIHSRKESMTLYAGKMELWNGNFIYPNINLELSKARHYVLGYQFRASDLLHLKSEVYYQQLYDIPAHPFPPYFTTMNFDFGFEGNVLTSYGSGYNAGVELLIERKMHRGFHFMWNATVFDSKYKNKLGEMLPTKYNSRFATNGLVGKEFAVGKNKEHLISLSSRYIYTGGMRFLPIDEEASRENGYTIRNWDNGFEGQYPDYLRFDLLVKFRRNQLKYAGEWSLDFLNVLSRKNVRRDYWDTQSQSVQYTYQNPFIVVLSYRIQF
jgi:hypothetical protein